MRTSYEEKLAGKEWSTIRFCFKWNFQSAHAKENNAAIAINTGRHENGPLASRMVTKQRHGYLNLLLCLYILYSKQHENNRK